MADRAYEFKALPLQLEVLRGGRSLPITQVPELQKGDRVRLRIDLSRPEFNSDNGRERQRLRDWSIGWFLTTRDGSLVYNNDNPRRGPADLGRIDLYREQTESVMEVADEQQKFPVLVLVRTRTLDSWDYIRQTREKKQANFVDVFGRYSEAVDHYRNLQLFLRALDTEGSRGEHLAERLADGFTELGFTVDTRMQLTKPETVAKLLSEVDRNFLRDGKTIQADVAGKAVSRMIADNNLGLVGVAVQLGLLVYEASEYEESYRWSSARLKPDKAGYVVMSSESIRYGEKEEAPDGQVRNNVRSILVCTPMPTEAVKTPTLGWSCNDDNHLVPGQQQRLELRIGEDVYRAGTQPALVERFASSDCRVWDSLNGQASPVEARLSPRGELVLSNLDELWKEGALEADLRVVGQWGFEPLPLLECRLFKTPAEVELTLSRSAHILTRGKKYRLELTASDTTAVGRARFRDQDLPLEAALAPAERGKRYALVLDLSEAPVGPGDLDLYAGHELSRSMRLLHRKIQVVPSARFHVVLPQGSPVCELVTDDEAVKDALRDVARIRLGTNQVFQRKGQSWLFEGKPPQAQELKSSGYQAELLYEDAEKDPVPNVFLQYEQHPDDLDFILYPPAPAQPQGYRVELDSLHSRVLASGRPVEFRVVAPNAWRGDSMVGLCIETPLFSDRCTTFAYNPAEGQSRLRIKRNILFGSFTPDRAGQLGCRFSTGIEGAQLQVQWEMPTEWVVVDVPAIDKVEYTSGRCYLEGKDLDVLVARVFRSGDPAVDAIGAGLTRTPEGVCTAKIDNFDPADFWLELRDLEGQRFRVRANDD